ncbi:hypothetical protein D9M70_627380 [compost metagenome]
MVPQVVIVDAQNARQKELKPIVLVTGTVIEPNIRRGQRFRLRFRFKQAETVERPYKAHHIVEGEARSDGRIGIDFLQSREC